MREVRNNDDADYRGCEDDGHRADQQSGLMFDDDFVGALAQRLASQMEHVSHSKVESSQSGVPVLPRLILAVISILAFLPITNMVLAAVAPAWWMLPPILGTIGLIFISINFIFAKMYRT